MSEAATSAVFASLAAQWRRRQLREFGMAALATTIVAGAFAHAGAFDLTRYADAAPTVLRLVADSTPPDFSRWRQWGRPLLETLATGVAGTAFGAALALPLAALAARNIGSSVWIGHAVCWR